MRKSMLRMIACVVSVILILSASPMSRKAFAADNSFLNGLSSDEKLLAEAVYTGYLNKAAMINEEVAMFARPKFEKISKALQEKMLVNKSAFENVTLQEPDLSAIINAIPPEAMLAMIPAENKEKAAAKAQEQVGDEIRQNFVDLPPKIEADIKNSIDLVSSDISEEIKQMIKILIYEVGDMVDTTISDSIEAEIMKVVPTILEDLPEDLQDLSPEEIAIHYQEKIRPAAEAALRPVLEIEIKAVISQMVTDIIEEPLNELMQPQLAQVNSDTCLSVITQIPSYAMAFVPETFIKSTVDAEIAKLNASLPAMVENQQREMQATVKKIIDDFIDQQTKLYVNGKLSNIKVRVLNSNSFLTWDSTMKVIGAKSKYNSKSKTITVTKADTRVEFVLGSRTVKVNGKIIKNALEQGEQPQLIKKTPVLPIEEVAGFFGYDSSYNQEWGMTVIGVAADK